MKPILSALSWVGIYLLLVLAPLAMFKIGDVPPGLGFWWDLSLALGFAGMAMMGLQFLLTARFQRASAPFGIDIIYHLHKYLAIIGFIFILTHFFIIFFYNPEAAGSPNPIQAPWYMTAGRMSMVLLALIIITSLWRKTLRIPYELWRMLHIFLAVTAFLLALLHIVGAAYYLATPAKQWLWTAYTLFWLFVIAYVRLLKPWRMYRRPYRVTELRQERGDSWTLALEPDGHPGMPFQPGQFAWLTLRASPWHIKEHPLSFSSSAERLPRLEFTIKEQGDFTRTIKHTRIGEVAYLDGPYGIFSVDRYHDAPGFVFVAGGVGAAPIVSMLRTLADRQEPRPLWLIYGNKNWDDVIFREELELLQRHLNLRLLHVLEQAPENWSGESGLVTPQLLKSWLPADARRYEYFLCGPKAMSDQVQQALADMQVPLGKVHFELFDMV